MATRIAMRRFSTEEQPVVKSIIVQYEFFLGAIPAWSGVGRKVLNDMKKQKNIYKQKSHKHFSWVNKF